MIDNDQKQNIAEIFLLWFFRISGVRIWRKERNKSCLRGKNRESIRVIIRNDDDLGTISGWWGAGLAFWKSACNNVRDVNKRELPCLHLFVSSLLPVPF